MGYEVDFLAVGDGERSGDAIALRLGNIKGPRDQQTVLVIDGGTKESGAKLVQHIRKYYGTNRVDIVVSSHPDSDHSSGLTVVLEEMDVGVLLMHQPWNHGEEIRACLNDAKMKSRVEERVWRALEDARALEKLATAKGIPIKEPFSDIFKFVLSPSKEFYEQQVANFRCMPAGAEKAKAAEFVKALFGVIKGIAKAIESWFVETLTDPEEDATSAENNSSVVMIIDVDRERFLFTADAGVPALTEAANRAEALGIDLKAIKYVQVPHHGSRRNVGPTILNRILGPIKDENGSGKYAFASAAKDSDKHPAKKVTNAFKRRGAKVYATQGRPVCQRSNDAPLREGWSAITDLPLYAEVED